MTLILITAMVAVLVLNAPQNLLLVRGAALQRITPANTTQTIILIEVKNA